MLIGDFTAIHSYLDCYNIFHFCAIDGQNIQLLTYVTPNYVYFRIYVSQ